MFRDERQWLKVVAGVAGVLVGVSLAMVFLPLSPNLRLLMLGLALSGHMAVLLLGSMLSHRRRLSVQNGRPERFRFKRYPETSHVEPPSHRGRVEPEPLEAVRASRKETE